MSLDELVGGFMIAMGGDPIAREDDGHYHFDIDGTMLTVADDGVLVHFIASAGAVPMRGREQLYRELLEATFPGGDTDDNVLALDPDGECVCLYRCESLDKMDVQRFGEIFHSFGGVLMKWRDRLANGMPRAAAARPAEKKPDNVASLTSASAVPASLRGFDRG